MKKHFIFLCLILWGCASNHIPTQVFTSPVAHISNHTKNISKIVVASTSNFQDSIEANQEVYSSEQKGIRTRVESGGAELLSSYINILRENYKDQLLLVDAGGIFKSNSTLNEFPKTIELFQKLKYDAIGFSDNESFLLKLNDQKKELPFLSSNLLDLNTGKHLKKIGIRPFLIKRVNGIKVGITSLNFYKESKRQKSHAIYYEDPVLSFLKTKKLLKRKKTNLIVLIIHTYGDKDKLAAFIKRLPPKSVDVIVTDHIQDGPNSMREIPILYAAGKGKYLSHIELFYDKKQKKIITGMSQYYGQTKTCRFFFSSTSDCHIANNDSYEKKLGKIQESSFKTSDAIFLDHIIKRDANISSLIEKN
jgi:2',3'-cyclic-nucleotide 2'-phosphodiesterase (5'-nucleotidase family)